MKTRKNSDAEKFAEEISGEIFKAIKKRPNDLFMAECVSMGRLVANGTIDRTSAKEAMIARFVNVLVGHMADVKQGTLAFKSKIASKS